jgi:hypothetical protein
VDVSTGSLSVHDGTLTVDFGPLGITGIRILGTGGRSTEGNGRYQLMLDTKGTGVFDTSLDFFRLFGDVDGSGTIDAIDIAAVDQAFITGIWNVDADLNGDGVVNILDKFPLSRLRGTSI